MYVSINKKHILHCIYNNIETNCIFRKSIQILFYTVYRGTGNSEQQNLLYKGTGKQKETKLA